MGFIGLCYLNLLSLSPAGRIVVTDLNDWRLEQALKHGATDIINSGREDPVKRLKEINNGRLADALFVAVPNVHVWDQAMDMCEKGATLSFGTPLNPDVNWPINPYKMWLSGIKINLTYSTTHIETKAVLELIASGRLDVESFVTNRFNLDKVPEAIKLYKQAGESFKQVIGPNYKK